ncbi:MAG: hypothetical protein GX410_09410 [Elusimicrobia bacterium]|nr:hypothetical protein [Elusimicrobiota bacterium]
MTAKSDDASLDKLCNYDKSGTTDQNIDNVNGALNDMNAANEQLTAESCQDAFDNNGWSCGVINYTQTKAAAFLTQVNSMCSNYFVSRSLEETEGKTNFWTGSAGYMNYSDQHLKAEQAYKQQLESDDYKKAIEDMTNLDQKMNGSDSDGTGTGTNDGVSQMKSNYYANDCTYEEQGIGEFTADQADVVGGDSQWKKMYDAVTGALSDAWNGVSTWVTNAWNDASTWVKNAFNDAVAWTEQAVDDVGEWIGNAYEDASEWVNNAVNDAVDWTVQAANDAGEWITNAANDVGDAVSGFVSDVGDTLGDAWNSVTNWLGF